jgi:hypothetical protein
VWPDGDVITVGCDKGTVTKGGCVGKAPTLAVGEFVGYEELLTKSDVGEFVGYEEPLTKWEVGEFVGVSLQLSGSRSPHNEIPDEVCVPPGMGVVKLGGHVVLVTRIC